MRRAFFFLLLAFAAPALATPGSARWSVSQREGVWWLVDPAGRLTISRGVNLVQFAPDVGRVSGVSLVGEAHRALHGDETTWRAAAARDLQSWGFDTLGAWSDPLVAQADPEAPLARVGMLDLGARWINRDGSAHAWMHGLFPDVFDPAFSEFCRTEAARLAGRHRDDGSLLGWFIDNELRWAGDWRRLDEHLVDFLNAPAGTPGRRHARDFLRRRHPELSSLRRVWRVMLEDWATFEAAPIPAPHSRPEIYERDSLSTEDAPASPDPDRDAFFADCDAFAAELAERYFATTVAAIRAADPGRLVLGTRFAYFPGDAVAAAAARHLDVVSINLYYVRDPRPLLARYATFGRPLLIGEFAFRARESGLPNTKGAGDIVDTLAERAAAFEFFVRSALSEPALVGYHWFQYADQPAEGRFDGEDSNYGLINAHAEPYAELVAAMRRVNTAAPALHAASASPRNPAPPPHENPTPPPPP
jgi:agarase